MLNKIVLVGRLTRDPDLRYTQQGDAVCGFTLAVNRRKRDEADFIPIVVWKQQAENCAQYIAKGSMVAVEGRLQLRSYEDKDGNKRNVAEVIADSVQFLDSRNKLRDDEPQAGSVHGDVADLAARIMGGRVYDDEVPY